MCNSVDRRRLYVALQLIVYFQFTPALQIHGGCFCRHLTRCHSPIFAPSFLLFTERNQVQPCLPTPLLVPIQASTLPFFLICLLFTPTSISNRSVIFVNSFCHDSKPRKLNGKAGSVEQEASSFFGTYGDVLLIGSGLFVLFSLGSSCNSTTVSHFGLVIWSVCKGVPNSR